MKIFSWGSNSHGQLGQGSDIEQLLLPKPINTSLNPKYITGGGKHTLILTVDGEIFECGDNDKGQLGKDLNTKLVNTFQHLSLPVKITKVTCGWDFNLGLTENGEVFGWGSNSFGQLGLSVKKVKCVFSPQKIFEEKAVDIGAGLRHSVVVSVEGLVYTCGFGRKGQLGVLVNGNIPSILDKFTIVEGVNNCTGISCGECHSLVKTKVNEYYSWGNNKYGQLGVDPVKIPVSVTPVRVLINTNITTDSKILSGWSHNVILTGQGDLISWGRNDFGQLGEQRDTTWKPEIVKFIKNVKQICLGSHHLVALTKTSEVFTCGWNEHGNCGNNNCENVLQPFKLKGFNNVKLIGCGAAHNFLLACFYGFFVADIKSKMDSKILEIDSSDLKPSFTIEKFTDVPLHIHNDMPYNTFFQSFLLLNKPCILNNATEDWPCVSKWISNNSLNINFLKTNLKDVEVPISNCEQREYNVQRKCTMKLFDYLEYWEKYKMDNNGLDCLYLKDWHFLKMFPNEEIYRVPSYFASDWLNEYYDYNPDFNDDYRFVYIGPKGSWTPFHADVFTSYSWSVNICGKKRWVLFPPGEEAHFQDSFGNLLYDIEPSLKNLKEKKIHSFEVIQEAGQGLFVPSGWHHQVWNLEDTISINHNWINGCNIHYIWSSLQKNLSAVMKEISDCKDMDNWMSQCQLILSSSFGMNYEFFHSFLVKIAKARISALKRNQNLEVFGNWCFGENHMIFDLKQVLNVLRCVENDENFSEIEANEKCDINHKLEFMSSLNSFLNFNG